jgi:hypothetical protein
LYALCCHLARKREQCHSCTLLCGCFSWPGRNLLHLLQVDILSS